MRRVNILVIILVLILGTFCNKKREDVLNPKVKLELDEYLEEVKDINGIPGLALAIIKGNDIIYKKFSGKALLKENKPVDDSTIFRIFSATKLITATGIFQLIEKGSISLEDKISEYFENLPEPWQGITIKNLLTHSSGLPDLRYPASLTDKEVMANLFKDPIAFEPGKEFRYNQTNYWLLAQVVEQVTGLSYDEFILKNQFEQSKSGVLFSSDSKEEIVDRASRYYFDSGKKEFIRDTTNNGTRAHSGNGLNISLDEFIDWNDRLDKNLLLSQKTKSLMWTPFVFGNQRDDFLKGWGVYDVNGHESFGFTGGNLAGFRKFVDEDLTIIFLSNGYIHPAYDIIINDIAKMLMEVPSKKRMALEKDVMKQVLDKNYKKAKEIFLELKKTDSDYNFDNLRWNINSIGNSFFRSENIPEALKVYRLNSEINPNWWVAQAGYAEGLENSGNKEKAIKFYTTAIRLNESNEYDYNTFMTKKLEELEK